MTTKDVEMKARILFRVSSTQQLVLEGTLSIQRQIITEHMKEKRKVMNYYEY